MKLKAHVMQSRPEVAYVGSHVHNIIAKVPYLEWFVRDFDPSGQNSRHFL